MASDWDWPFLSGLGGFKSTFLPPIAPKVPQKSLINERLKTILIQLRSQLEIYYGDRLVQIILFGSQARGDTHPASDIDVLVVLKGEVNPSEEIEKTSNIVADLSLKMDAVINQDGSKNPFSRLGSQPETT